MSEHGRAVVMRQYGPPDVLRVETVALPDLAPGDVRIRSIASAINHSDLEIRAGNWPVRSDPPFPYIPGLEVLGEIVVAGSAATEFAKGDRVITMMQGLGGVRAVRPGGYQEFVTAPASVVAPVPADIDPLAMAALGLAGVTAFEGLRRIGDLNGRRIAITGSAGGVGSAAIGIARAQGAEVVAVVSKAKQQDYVRALGAHESILAADLASGGLGSESLDGMLDAVAGASFDASVEALRPGAVLSLIGAVGGSRVTFNAYQLLEVTLTGYSSETLDGTALRRAIASIADWLRRGLLAAPAQTLFPLEQAATAHQRLEDHAVRGRVLLVHER